MDRDAMKKAAAEAALDYIEYGDIVGVGTGSTADHFIDALAGIKAKLDGAVASSEASAQRLQQLGIPVLDLNTTGDLRIYVDGTDEATRHLHLIKGGGGALTREKIVAEASEKFVCIADDSKLVDVLGSFPLPVEVIPMAQSLVGRNIVKLGGFPFCVMVLLPITVILLLIFKASILLILLPWRQSSIRYQGLSPMVFLPASLPIC